MKVAQTGEEFEVTLDGSVEDDVELQKFMEDHANGRVTIYTSHLPVREPRLTWRNFTMAVLSILAYSALVKEIAEFVIKWWKETY